MKLMLVISVLVNLSDPETYPSGQEVYKFLDPARCREAAVAYNNGATLPRASAATPSRPRYVCIEGVVQEDNS